MRAFQELLTSLGQSIGLPELAIYNVALTSSGQAENQTWNTGLPGSKNAKEAAARINDSAAQTYAMGFEEHVNA